MSTVTEIEAASERLSPAQIRELADWCQRRDEIHLLPAV